mmetsp:Transcript_13716/g.30242  ORF Transcript_13716/g.30242 Transcript_13716/m.30242 type:complete len:560 (+) Transcript_13716:2687-4366(+)
MYRWSEGYEVRFGSSPGSISDPCTASRMRLGNSATGKSGLSSWLLTRISCTVTANLTRSSERSTVISMPCNTRWNTSMGSAFTTDSPTDWMANSTEMKSWSGEKSPKVESWRLLLLRSTFDNLLMASAEDTELRLRLLLCRPPLCSPLAMLSWSCNISSTLVDPSARSRKSTAVWKSSRETLTLPRLLPSTWSVQQRSMACLHACTQPTNSISDEHLKLCLTDSIRIEKPKISLSGAPFAPVPVPVPVPSSAFCSSACALRLAPTGLSSMASSSSFREGGFSTRSTSSNRRNSPRFTGLRRLTMEERLLCFSRFSESGLPAPLKGARDEIARLRLVMLMREGGISTGEESGQSAESRWESGKAVGAASPSESVSLSDPLSAGLPSMALLSARGTSSFSLSIHSQISLARSALLTCLVASSAATMSASRTGALAHSSSNSSTLQPPLSSVSRVGPATELKRPRLSAPGTSPSKSKSSSASPPTCQSSASSGSSPGTTAAPLESVSCVMKGGSGAVTDASGLRSPSASLKEGLEEARRSVEYCAKTPRWSAICRIIQRVRL